MEDFTKNPKVVSKNMILDNSYIFSPSRYKYLQIKNTNTSKLSDIISLSTDTFNIRYFPGYYKYVEIGDINTHSGSIDYKTVRSIDIPSDTVGKLRFGDILISTVRTYLGGIAFVSKNDVDIVATKALIILRKLKIDISKYYLFGILRSNFFIEQTNIILNKCVYPRLEKNHLGELIIPFPTVKNNPIPKDVEKLISLIVQNIIDKGEQIEIKNNQIDKFIENELNNQGPSKVNYKFPTISKISNEDRFDTVLYGEKYQSLDFRVKNYIHSVMYLNRRDVSPGRTPKDYYFTEGKFPNTYEWVTPKNLGERQLLERMYLHSNKSANTRKNSLIFTGIRYVGNCFFVEGNSGPIYSNQNTLVINHSKDVTEQLFLLCYLSSKIGKQLQIMQRVKGIVPILYTDDLIKIPIPNFPQLKKEDVSKIFYNPLCKNIELTLNNYIEREKERNRMVGIYQLNTEIFELRSVLNELVNKIADEKMIDLKLEY